MSATEERTNSTLGIKVPLHRSLVFRAVVLSTSLAAGLLGVCLGYTYFDRRADPMQTLGLTFKSIAATAAPFIDGADINEVRTNDDAGADAFRRLLSALQVVRLHNGL